MKIKRKVFLGMYFIVVCLFLLGTGKSVQAYSVHLNILNIPGPYGEIAVVAGTDIEVEFEVGDPASELSKDDILRLVRVDDGFIIHEKKRGKLLSGSISLKTSREQSDGEVKVEYVHNDVIIASAPDNRMIIVANESELALLNRISALEAAVSVLGPSGPPGQIYPIGVISVTSYDDCLINEWGYNCREKAIIHVGVPLNAEALFKVHNIVTIQVYGEPFPIDEYIDVTLNNLPLQGAPGSEIFIHMVKHVPYTDNTYNLDFTLSPNNPYYGIDQAGGGFRLRASSVTDNQVLFEMGAAEKVSKVTTEGYGIISGGVIDPYEQGATDTRVSVGIQNYGDLRTNYVLTLTDFSPPADQVPPQARVLDPGAVATLVFDLHSDGGFDTGQLFKVRMIAPTGRLYDELGMTFP